MVTLVYELGEGAPEDAFKPSGSLSQLSVGESFSELLSHAGSVCFAGLRWQTGSFILHMCSGQIAPLNKPLNCAHAPRTFKFGWPAGCSCMDL